MKLLPHPADRVGNPVSVLAGIALALTIFVPCAGAKAQDTEAKPAEAKLPGTVETLYLTNSTSVNDLNDVLTDLRNMLPRAKLYGIQSQNAISIRATTEDLEMAKKVVADLDKPKKTYRVTYTITEIDGGKRVGAQRLAMTVIAGEKAWLKHGNRVPIVTGVSDTKTGETSQVQYLDVGLNIEAFLNGVSLRSKVEQSSVADEKSGLGTQDPLVHQTTLEETFNVASGKPVVIGSLDIPGTTRRQEIEVMVEPI